VAPLKDWTAVLQKFQHNLSAPTANENLAISSLDFPTQQLHALYDLHRNMGADKALFNMQLAATHISFMLHHNSEEIVSSVLQNFSKLN